MAKKSSSLTDSKQADALANLRRMIVDEAKDKYGKGVVSLASSTDTDVTDWISSGCYAFDWVTGGGLPLGKIVEFYGRESTGKSTLGYLLMSQVQARGGIVILIDTEGSYDSKRASSIGLRTDEIIFVQTQTIEDSFDFIHTTLAKIREENKTVPVGIMWDSVAGTPTKAEIDGEFGTFQMMGASRLISQAMRKMRPADRENTLILFINQLRAKPTQFGTSWVTYGGEAIKYYASVRLELAAPEQVKEIVDGVEQVTGVKVRLVAKKNKVAPPFRQTHLFIDFTKGIDSIATDVVYAIEVAELISKAGAMYSVGDKKWRGAAAVEEYYRENPQELRALLDAGKTQTVAEPENVE